MDPAQQALWQQADAILDQLLDLPAGQRPQALQAMALAPAVEDKVRRLLQAHQGAGVLDALPQVPAAPLAPADLGGRVLGRWRLQSRIGEGGMAVVYRAESVTPPLDQVAAVKILALGSLARDPTGQALLREQALLSRLRHPFIAPFHEAGISEDGTPWLAMGLVEGERIDQWCERRQADVAKRIGLVLEVADALSYAHRNLVIHRDIKPSNVLVDGDGHVRLLDFGIGHLLDQATERTATLLCALTPDYAAPEQFTGQPASTAVDVYGLGALLYRLLAGQPPSSPARVDQPTQSPSRRIARDAGLPPPQRRALSRQLRGDLDTIVMKALAPQPQERYASVDALAEDLRRWLSRRPIAARRPSLRYRLRLFLRRNRLAVGAGLALLLALAGGVAGTVWQARRATAQAALAEAAAERSRAQLAYLDSLLEDLVAPTTPDAPRRDTGELIRVAAERAAQQLAAQPEVLAGVESLLSTVAARAGYADLALQLAESVHDRLQAMPGADVQALARAKVDLAVQVRQADPPDHARARALAEAGEALLARQAPASAARVAALRELAVQHSDADDSQRSAALLDQAEAVCESLPEDEPDCDQTRLTHGSLLFRTGQHEKADALLGTLVQSRRRSFGDDHVATLTARYLQAVNTLRGGNPGRARPMLAQLLELQRAAYPQPTRETLRTLQGLAEAALADSDMQPARELARQVMEETRVVAGEASSELAMAYSQIGNVAFADGDYAEAEQAYGEARRRYGRIYGEQSLAYSIMTGSQADALREMGKVGQALALQEQATAIAEPLVQGQEWRLASRYSNHARTLAAAGREREALAMYGKAVALYLQGTPEGYNHHVVDAYRSSVLLALGEVEQAREVAAQARVALRAAAGEDSRYAIEALALELAAQCHAPASPACAGVASEARAALKLPRLAGKPRKMLQAALAGRRPG